VIGIDVNNMEYIFPFSSICSRRYRPDLINPNAIAKKEPNPTTVIVG
jgi:hypothetical protein